LSFRHDLILPAISKLLLHWQSQGFLSVHQQESAGDLKLLPWIWPIVAAISLIFLEPASVQMIAGFCRIHLIAISVIGKPDSLQTDKLLTNPDRAIMF
jgi:hypothetical protein